MSIEVPQRLGASANGEAIEGSTASQSQSNLSKEQLAASSAAAKQLAAAFGSVVTVLMRSKEHQSLTLSELEHRVIPALMTSQYAIAEGQSTTTGAVSPVGVLLWAQVSAEAIEPGRGSANSFRSSRMDQRRDSLAR